MTWDLKEPECLTLARLMTAAPEYVFEQIKFYGDNVDKFNGKSNVEKSLMTRGDRLINLALAQFASEKEVISEIYKSVSAEMGGGIDEIYAKGIRVACLSNRHLGFFNWPDFDLNALLSNGLTPEVRALLSNPAVLPSILVSLFTKTGCFAQIDDKNWLWMIQTAADNARLNIDESNMDGPDMELWDIHKAIFQFLASAPITSHSAHAAMSLLSALDPAHTAWPEAIDHVLQRWSGVEVKDYKKEDEKGWLTHLSFRDELRCLIAALYGRRSTKGKGSLCFGSAADPDIALRCAFYASSDLPEKEIEAGFKRDKDIFVFAVLKNKYVLLHKSKRALIESFLAGRFIREYQIRCEQIHKSNVYFDTKPVSELGRELIEGERDNKKSGASQIEAISAQISQLSDILKRYEKQAYWFFIVLIVVIVWVAKK